MKGAITMTRKEPPMAVDPQRTPPPQLLENLEQLPPELSRNPGRLEYERGYRDATQEAIRHALETREQYRNEGESEAHDAADHVKCRLERAMQMGFKEARSADFEAGVRAVYEAAGWQGGTMHQLKAEFAELARLRADNEQLQVQLAGCGVAAQAARRQGGEYERGRRDERADVVAFLKPGIHKPAMNCGPCELCQSLAMAAACIDSRDHLPAAPHGEEGKR